MASLAVEHSFQQEKDKTLEGLHSEVRYLSSVPACKQITAKSLDERLISLRL